MGAVRRLGGFGLVALVVLLASAGVAAAPGSARSLVAGGGSMPGAIATRQSPQTIYDPGPRVTWLANADLAATATFKFGLGGINADGSMDYATAKEWVRLLNRHKYLGHDNWTMPITPTPNSDSDCSGYNRKGGGWFGLGCTIAPLASLYKYVLRLKSPDTAVQVPDTTTGPFHDFQPYLYWTGIQAKNPSQGFRTLSFNTGWPGSNIYQHFMYVLPILPGNPFNANPAGSGGLYPVDGGSAVYEPGIGTKHEGVTWLADADLAKSQTFNVGNIDKDGSMEQTTAVNWLQQLNQNQLLQQKGWDLPTEKDLSALYSALSLSENQPVVPVPNTTLHGFQNIQPYLYWSCAGTSVQGPCRGKPNKHPQQWSFSFGNGYLGTDLTSNDLYVMVYYPSAVPKPPILPPGRCSPRSPGQPITCK